MLRRSCNSVSIGSVFADSLTKRHPSLETVDPLRVENYSEYFHDSSTALARANEMGCFLDSIGSVSYRNAKPCSLKHFNIVEIISYGQDRLGLQVKQRSKSEHPGELSSCVRVHLNKCFS